MIGISRLRWLGLASVLSFGCGGNDSPSSPGTAGTSSAGAASAGSSSGGRPAMGGANGTAGSTAGAATIGGEGGSNAGAGTTGDGGVPSEGGTGAGGSEGGSDAGGESPGAGGVEAAGGAASSAGEQVCSEYAEFYAQKAAATSCADASAMLKNLCLQGYAAGTCVNEAANYFECAALLPDDSFECRSNQVWPKVGNCTLESAAYILCNL